MTWPYRFFAAFATFLAVATVGLLWAFPVIAAIACPSCFDLERVSATLYAEASMSDEQRRRLSEDVTRAASDVDAFAWSRLAGQRPTLYAAAACKVLTWLEKNGGRAGVLATLPDVSNGTRTLP